MKIAVLIASRNRPDLVEPLAKFLGQNVQVDADWILVEAGTDPEKLTPLTTIHFEDEEFSGFCMAHAVGMEHARKLSKDGQDFDYYYVLTTDLRFDEGVDPVAPLIEVMESHPELGILAHTRRPAETEDLHAKGPVERDSLQRTGGGWREAVLSTPTGFLIRADVVEECGFLNSAFRYGAGAMAELSYTLHRAGWSLGYSDDVAYTRVGETTYGVEGTKTISSADFERRALRFAYMYFLRICGPNWSETFAAEARTRGLSADAYGHERRSWARAFQPDELSDLHAKVFSAKPLDLPAPEPESEPTSSSLTPLPSSKDETPWPLATEAPHRLLAWPRYDDASDIETLLSVWGDALIDEPERCLCLRLDPELDIDLASATTLLEDVYARVVGDEHSLDVLFVNGPMTEKDLHRLGLAVEGMLEIPDCEDPIRRKFAETVAAPALASLHELLLQP